MKDGFENFKKFNSGLRCILENDFSPELVSDVDKSKPSDDTKIKKGIIDKNIEKGKKMRDKLKNKFANKKKEFLSKNLAKDDKPTTQPKPNLNQKDFDKEFIHQNNLELQDQEALTGMQSFVNLGNVDRDDSKDEQTSDENFSLKLSQDEKICTNCLASIDSEKKWEIFVFIHLQGNPETNKHNVEIKSCGHPIHTSCFNKVESKLFSKKN